MDHDREIHFPLVYVAGPYSNPDPVENTKLAIDFGMRLWDERLAAPIVPHTTLLIHLLHPRGIGDWYEMDMEVLARCDAIFRLPGDSSGADAEVEFAEENGIPVFNNYLLLAAWCEENK